MAAIALQPITMVTSGGTSDVAGYVTRQKAEPWRQLQNTFYLGQQSKGSVNELIQVLAVCKSANWDGYGARPVSTQTYMLARKFLEALPLGSPSPSIGADPDGDITCEWYAAARKTLSVSISASGDLHYAALIGTVKAYGTEPFSGNIPRVILDLIRRVISA